MILRNVEQNSLKMCHGQFERLGWQDPSPVLPATAHPLTGENEPGPMDANAAPTQKQQHLHK